MPPSVLDLEFEIPLIPFKLFGLTHADCFSLGTSESLLQGTQSATFLDRLSATIFPAGQVLHCDNF